MPDELNHYRYGGARALVLLHERHLREFLATWKEARAAGLELPETDDPSYASLAALLVHVLRAATGYMFWICRALRLPDPEIRLAPDPEDAAAVADDYTEHLLERWRLPLAEIPEDRFYHPEYTSSWGTQYCIDAMLEHAVMHPIRHTFQLRNWLAG